MARKAAWEELAEADLGPYAKSRGTRWGRVFAGLSLVVFGTFVAAYYLPLYRAHQQLDQQYQELSQRARGLTDSVVKAEQAMKTTAEERDQLKAEHDRSETAQQVVAASAERAKLALSSKLDKFLKKGNAALVIDAGSLFVALDGPLLFLPQKLELTPTARLLLCDIAKTAGAKSLVVRASLAAGTVVPALLARSYPNPWALSAARAAAVADSLQVTCSVPESQLSAIGSGPNDALVTQLTSSKLSPDRVELQLAFR